MAPALPIADLVKVTGFAILEVVFLCLVGFALAWFGVIDGRLKTGLNKVNVNIFTPALLFSKVAFALTPAKLAQLWLVPVFFVLVSAVSALVGWAAGHAFRLNRSQRAFAIACSMFNNSNSLPIAIMQSLVTSVPALQWIQPDSQEQMLGRALSYLVIYSTLGIILRWSLGVRLLSVADVPDAPQDDHKAPRRSDEGPNMRPPSLSSADREEVLEHGADDQAAAHALGLNVTAEFLAPSQERAEEGRHAKPYTNASAMSSRTLLEMDEPHAPTDAQELDAKQPQINPTRSKRAVSFVVKSWRVLNEFMTAPLWAALASIIIACIPPIQDFLNNDFPPLKEAIINAGNCSVPITLVTLGAYFKPKGKASSTSSRKAPAHDLEAVAGAPRPPSPSPESPARGERRTILVSVLVRMVLVPAVLLPPLFAFATRTEVGVIEDPVFLMVLCLLIGAPPAITIAQLTTAAAGDTFERLISQTILISYAVVTPITTIGLALVALWMASL